MLLTSIIRTRILSPEIFVSVIQSEYLNNVIKVVKLTWDCWFLLRLSQTMSRRPIITKERSQTGEKHLFYRQTLKLLY